MAHVPKGLSLLPVPRKLGIKKTAFSLSLCLLTYADITSLLIFILFISAYSAAPGLTCGIHTLSYGVWDLVPQPGIESRPPALGMQSLSHWTTREVPDVTEISELM